MPKIAQYQPDQIRSEVVAQPTASANIPSAAFGSPLAQGVSDVAKAAEEIKNKIDTTSAEEALINFEREKNKLFFDPDNGYFKKQGRDAYDQSETVLKSLSDLKKKYSEGLTQSAKTMYDRIADKHITKSQVEVAKHASDGLKTWELSTLEARVENSIENASYYYDDKDKLLTNMADGESAVFDSASKLGLSYEAVAERVDNFRSSFAMSAITAAAQDDTLKAEKLLDKFDKMLEGPDKVKMKKLIEKRKKVEKTKADADLAVTMATNLVDKYGDDPEGRSKIITDIREMVTDPDLRKKVESQAMIKYNRVKTAKKEIASNAYAQAIDLINGKGGRPMTAIELQGQYPEIWEAMEPIQRNNILSGKHMVTDQILYNKLMGLSRAEKAKIDLGDYSGRFNPADERRLSKAIDRAREWKPETAIETTSKKIRKDAVFLYGDEKKWYKKNGGFTPKGEKADAFIREVQSRITQYESEKKRDITPGEIDKIRSEYTNELIAERKLFNAENPVFDWISDYLSPDVKLSAKDIPLDHIRLLNTIKTNFQDQIDETRLVETYLYLIDNDIPVNTSTMTQYYNRKGK